MEDSLWTGTRSLWAIARCNRRRRNWRCCWRDFACPTRVCVPRLPWLLPRPYTADVGETAREKANKKAIVNSGVHWGARANMYTLYRNWGWTSGNALANGRRDQLGRQCVSGSRCSKLLLPRNFFRVRLVCILGPKAVISNWTD